MTPPPQESVSEGQIGRSACWQSNFPQACLVTLFLTALQILLIVKIDNTNLATGNGLWKTPDIYRWEHATAKPTDASGVLYFPVYGYLSRLIPDRFVSYGIHGDVVTYRKLSILNAVFSGVASGAVFSLARLLTGSLLGAFVVTLAHAFSGFVLLNSLNSEDVMPAYAFFTLTALFTLEYILTWRYSFAALAAVALALVALFHWTLLIPGMAASAAVHGAVVVQDRRRIRQALVFLLAFLLALEAGVFLVSALTSHSLPLWQVLYPGNAQAASGWLGLRWGKAIYAVIGVGNYFSGGFNIGNHHDAFDSPLVLKTMSASWIYLAITGAGCVWAISSRRLDNATRLMALFAVGVFVVGEIEHLYSQPQDPQSQIQPMFITVIGLAVLLRYWMDSQGEKAWRLGSVLTVLLMANGAENLQLMFAQRGLDSEAVKGAQKLIELFPPANTFVVTQGMEGCNTWQYLVVYRGNFEDYIHNNGLLTSPFTNQAGISAQQAARMTRQRIDGALARGYRVVAGALWTEPRGERFVDGLTTVVERERARAYYDLLRPAYGVGQSWDTPCGRFVELRRAAGASTP